MPAKLVNRLPEIIASLQPRTQASLKEAVDAVAAGAKERVPVDTGRLRDAIHVDETAEGFSIVAGNTEAFYGHMVEFGTTHSAAEPFLLPAFEAGKEGIKDAVRGALRDL